jgi:hypothetical protein
LSANLGETWLCRSERRAAEGRNDRKERVDKRRSNNNYIRLG